MRKVLQSLVASGNTLLHGSPKQFDEAFPSLADDELAVCATPCAEIAITMALMKACIGRGGYTASLSKSKCNLEIRVCEKLLSALLHKKVVGYVHVMDAAHFSKKSPFEFRAYESLYVQKSIKVTNEDLPFVPVAGQLIYKIPVNRNVTAMVN